MADRAETAEIVAHEAKGIASEAMSSVNAHDRLNTMRFDNMDKKVDEVKELIHSLDKKVDRGISSNDQKFWSLAIALIAILLGTLGWFINFMIQNIGNLHHG